MWGCRPHWFTLPREIRTVIWANYVPGQEIRKDPTAQYLEAAKIADDWARRYEKERASSCSICAEKIPADTKFFYTDDGIKKTTCEWCHHALANTSIQQKFSHERGKKTNPVKILREHIKQYGKNVLL